MTIVRAAKVFQLIGWILASYILSDEVDVVNLKIFPATKNLTLSDS